MSDRLGELLVKAGKTHAGPAEASPGQTARRGRPHRLQPGEYGAHHRARAGGVPVEAVPGLRDQPRAGGDRRVGGEADPADVARKYTIMPVSKAGAKVTIAMLDPTNVFAMDDIKFMTGYNVEPVIASETAIRQAIEKYYGATHALELKKVMEDLDEDAGGATSRCSTRSRKSSTSTPWKTSRTRRRWCVCATSSSPTPSSAAPPTSTSSLTRRSTACRYRVDGLLYEVMHPPLRLREAITQPPQDHGQARHRREALPQDGRIKIKTKIERQGQGARLPRLGAADDLRREDRACGCSTKTT